jgi:hypothetical protein
VVGFADVVVAQQNMLNAVSQYISALSDQWTAFADIGGLLQVDSLRELQLQLREKGSEPEPVPGMEQGNRGSPPVSDVTSLFTDARTVEKSPAPTAIKNVAHVEDDPGSEVHQIPDDE